LNERHLLSWTRKRSRSFICVYVIILQITQKVVNRFGLNILRPRFIGRGQSD